jgi:hypothetical protein
MHRVKINKNIFIKSIIFVTSLLILFRSVNRTISDYDSYRRGGKLILNDFINVIDKLPYDSSWGNFENRGSNGPIWLLFISPFELVPYTPAIILFRLVVIISSFILIKKVATELEFNKDLLVLFSFVIMLFPFRFLVNTSQGSTIAYLVGVYSLILLLKENLRNIDFFLIGFAIVLCINYKPHLFIPFTVWLFVNKKIKIMLSALIVGIVLEFILYFNAPNSTQLSWLKYLLARSDHIDQASYQLKYGPLTLIYEFFKLNTTWIYIISFLMLFLMGFYFNKIPCNFRSGLTAMSLGVFIGPYSPTHDQTLIALIFGIIFVNYNLRNKFNILIFLPLLFWIYPSEFTILKQLIIFLVYAMIVLFLSNFINFFIFTILFIVNECFFFNWLNSEAIYLVTGLGALFTLPFINRFQTLTFKSNKV